MIKLIEFLKETTNIDTLSSNFFQEFYRETGVRAPFKYLGLKNKEHVYTVPINDLGTLSLIISDALIMARITDTYAYFGVVYTLNGLEQFDATICMIKKENSGMILKKFDDSDPDFSDAKTNFAKLVKVMS